MDANGVSRFSHLEVVEDVQASNLDVNAGVLPRLRIDTLELAVGDVHGEAVQIQAVVGAATNTPQTRSERRGKAVRKRACGEREGTRRPSALRVSKKHAVWGLGVQNNRLRSCQSFLATRSHRPFSLPALATDSLVALSSLLPHLVLIVTEVTTPKSP